MSASPRLAIRPEPVVTPRKSSATAWLLPVAVVVAVVLALAERVLHAGWPYWMEDFGVFRMGAHTVLTGGPLYHATAQGTGLLFTYTPLAALLFVPLTLGSASVTSIAWCAAELFFLQLTAWVALGAIGVRSAGRRAGIAMLVTTGAILLDPVDSDLSLGQINILLMFLVLADLLLGERRRWQGVGVGLAAAVKLIPLLFVVYLLLTRRVRAAATAATVFLLGMGVGFAVLPGDSRDYWRGAGFDPARVGTPQSPFNQSLRAVFARLLHTASTLSVPWLLAAIAVAAGGLWISVALYRAGDTLASVLAAALTSTLVSPVAWEHHWVWVVPLLILLGERTVRLRSVFWGVTTVVVALAFGLRLLYWYVPVDDAADLRLGLPQQLAADCFPLVGLAVLVVLAVIATRRPPVRPAVAP